jgi:outer membrane protein TolC
VVYCLFLVCSTALADDGGALRFDDAVRLALAEGAQAHIVEASAAADGATAREGAAWQGNPELSAEIRPDEATVMLSVPVDFGVLARSGAAALELDAVDLRAAAGRAAVAAAAGAAYLDAVRAAQLAALAVDAESVARRSQAGVDARLGAGELGPAEHALLRADVAAALDVALSRRRDADAAARRLGVLLGRESPVQVREWPDLALPEALSDPAFIQRIPTVMAAEVEARSALKALRAAELSRIPALSLTGGWALSGHAGPVYGASLTLPLFAPGAARVSGARALSDGRAAESDWVALDAGAALSDARAELEIATQIAAAWQIPGLQDALDAAARRYVAGECALGGYVQERDLALSALEQAIEAQWRLQRARLALWELAGACPVENAR